MKRSKTILVNKLSSLIKHTILTLAVFVSRLGLLAPNFSPVGPFGFFSRSIWPLLIITLGFDILRGGLYPGAIWTHIGFLSYWVIGRIAHKIKEKNGSSFFVLLLPVASTTFFLLSNFGVWLYWYPNTISGLIACYTLALPFFRNTLLGDMFFGFSWVLLLKFQPKIKSILNRYTKSVQVVNQPANKL